jgi:hypothetical protein
MIMTLNERNGLYEQPAIHDSESGKAGTGLHHRANKTRLGECTLAFPWLTDYESRHLLWL